MLGQEEEEECSRQENTLRFHGDEAGLCRGPEGLASQDTVSSVLPSSLRKPPGLHPQLRTAKRVLHSSFPPSSFSALGPLTVTAARAQTVTKEDTRHFLRGRNGSHWHLSQPVWAVFTSLLCPPQGRRGERGKPHWQWGPGGQPESAGPAGNSGEPGLDRGKENSRTGRQGTPILLPLPRGWGGPGAFPRLPLKCKIYNVRTQTLLQADLSTSSKEDTI